MSYYLLRRQDLCLEKLFPNEASLVSIQILSTRKQMSIKDSQSPESSICRVIMFYPEENVTQ